MPGLARKSGWNAVRTEPFDFSLPYTSCAVCRYSGATKGTFIQQGCSAITLSARDGHWRNPRRKNRECSNIKERVSWCQCTDVLSATQTCWGAAESFSIMLAIAGISPGTRFTTSCLNHWQWAMRYYWSPEENNLWLLIIRNLEPDRHVSFIAIGKKAGFLRRG